MPDHDSGTILHIGQTLIHQYEIMKVLGVGGFGITYQCRDIRLMQLVAIKEFFPETICVREASGEVRAKSRHQMEIFERFKSRFVDEGRTLARFKHPNMVRVQNYFEANGTAYLVLEYEEGKSLEQMLREQGTLSESAILGLIHPLLDGLSHLHAHGIIHRDIKPANIFIRTDGSPVLLDFGAARYALGEETKTMTAILTPGYAPMEQYFSDGKQQGSWSDIYAIAALIYRLMSGEAPAEASQRSAEQLRDGKDPLRPLKEIVEGRYSLKLIDAVEKGLRILPDDRPQSIKDWLEILPEMKSHPSVTTKVKPKEPDKEIEDAPWSREEIDRVIDSESATEAPEQKRIEKVGFLLGKIFLKTVGLFFAFFSFGFLIFMISERRNYFIATILMLISGFISFASFRISSRKVSSGKMDRDKPIKGMASSPDIPYSLVKKFFIGVLIFVMSIFTIISFAFFLKGRYLLGGILTLCFGFLTYASYDITR